MNTAKTPVGQNYRRYVLGQLQVLTDLLGQAAAGDYQPDLPDIDSRDEFSPLYAGLRQLLDASSNRLAQLEKANSELEDIIAARTTELFGSETRFQAVADAAGDAIVTTNQQGAVIYLNRAAEIIFGQALIDIEGKPLTILMPDLDPAYLKARPASPIRPSRKLGKLVQATARHRNGRQFPVEISFATWQAGAKTQYITSIVRDLTVHQLLVNKLALRTADLKRQVDDQTKQLRQRLTEAERDKAEDEALLGSIGEGVVAVSKTGQIFFANREFAALAGTTTEYVKGRNYYDVVTIQDQAGRPVPLSRRPMQRTLESGRRTYSTDYLYRSPSGRLLPVSITAAPIVVKGRIIGGIDVIRDITKEKEADRLKSEFVSLASHQLRTPATAVKGLLSLLLEGYSGKFKRGQVTTLRQAFVENEHELRLIDDMLDVAKLDAGEIVLESSPIDLAGMIRAVIKEQEPLTQARKQTVTLRLPRQKIKNPLADPLKLQMVFENLLTNASKYTPSGGTVTITIQPAPGQVEVIFRDNGIGIAAKDQPKLFKRFSRATNASKTHASGSGLGLYLAKKIIDLHHGRITVASRLGQGATFTVTLPWEPRSVRKPHQTVPLSN